MSNVKKWIPVSLIAIAVVIAASVFAVETKEVVGQLVSLNSQDRSMTVEVETKGAVKEFINFKIASDARWHICLADRCVITKGVEGFRIVNEYANFEAYGIPHKSYRVTLTQTGDTVSSVDVEIVPGRHTGEKK